jgi:hypothetical protein
LALLANGTVMAWGANGSGQLGDEQLAGPETCGAAACSKSPVSVPGLSGVVAITAIGEYNLALLANGTVMAWGENGKYQLGDGSEHEEKDLPTQVKNVAGASAIAAGEENSFALIGPPRPSRLPSPAPVRERWGPRACSAPPPVKPATPKARWRSSEQNQSQAKPSPASLVLAPAQPLAT